MRKTNFATNEMSLEKLWEETNFSPNENQRKAIEAIEGPVFLTAGPGSGKTRVLLWRTLNLIVFHKVKPEEIFLSTFTEKAALQLKEGLKSLLGIVTNKSSIPYDISKMSLGTVHSICQKLITDRRISNEGARKIPPKLMDELEQYFYFYNKRKWKEFYEIGDFEDEEKANRAINLFFSGKDFYSKHQAVTSLIDIFNRFSEERLNTSILKTNNEIVKRLLKMYEYYLNDLGKDRIKITDFSLLQQEAYNNLLISVNSKNVFKHIIIDEYQDTNTIQELIFFELAKGNKNICIVGDDDQALYRFRGATVENLVEFEVRCKKYLNIKPTIINLNKNYRSKNEIVECYGKFINLIDWKKNSGKGFYRVISKEIISERIDKSPGVLVSEKNNASEVYIEIAKFIKKLKEENKIEDYNQVAFLFPYLKKSSRVKGFKVAFEAEGIPVYAPRAGRFLEVDEAVDVYGLMMQLFGKPKHDFKASSGLRDFQKWMSLCDDTAAMIIKNDKNIKEFISDKKSEITTVLKDYEILIHYLEKKNIELNDNFNLNMRRSIINLSGLSEKAKKLLSNNFFEKVIERRQKDGKPFTVKYIVNSMTSLDWSILDLFYQLNGFHHFREMYRLAHEGIDEGPICNLGLITQYIARFLENYGNVLTASFLKDDKFINTFFSSFTYALFRREETEYEDRDDPFPKGRVPFLTIHQAKGLEFPVVVLGSLYKQNREPSMREIIVRDLLKKEGEPLDRIDGFDIMRMFYVALSRAKELVILPRYTKGKAATESFKKLINDNSYTNIKDFKIKNLMESKINKDDLGRTYSYTSDYLFYQKCPRNYMIFKKYGFVPSRSQTMFFGSLVHKTIEDLHHYLIQSRNKSHA